MELEPFVFIHEGAVVSTRSHVDADDYMHDVNRFTLRPLENAEVSVFTLDLCHNQIDRHHSRFPDEELERISGMVPGRPLMERHDLKGSLPRGTFFRSSLHRSADRISVRPDVYVLRTPDNEGFILNIEGGVYRETSIGFAFRMPECSICKKDMRKCDHVPGYEYKGQQCHYVMRDVLEVIEGSVVPAGSQGTSFVAQQRALPLADALDSARRAFHEPIEIDSRLYWANE